MTESTANAASREVLGTHKGMKGKDLEDYMKTFWSKSWGHFDVN